MLNTMFSSFWDFLLALFSIFVLIAYLSALFAVVWDLVSDRSLNGWWKALWLVFLLFVPLVTALVYLISRGRGMAERQHERALTRTQATEEYIRSVAETDPVSVIERAKGLLDSGAITEEEYAALKRDAIAGHSA